MKLSLIFQGLSPTHRRFWLGLTVPQVLVPLPKDIPCLVQQKSPAFLHRDLLRVLFCGLPWSPLTTELLLPQVLKPQSLWCLLLQETPWPSKHRKCPSADWEPCWSAGCYHDRLMEKQSIIKITSNYLVVELWNGYSCYFTQWAFLLVFLPAFKYAKLYQYSRSMLYTTASETLHCSYHRICFHYLDLLWWTDFVIQGKMYGWSKHWNFK